MRTLLLIILLSLTACASKEFVNTSSIDLKNAFPGGAKQEFVPGTEDLPLYHGFKAEKGNVAYDSVDGRIIDASFVSRTVQTENVRSYYDLTLPQLGWNKLEYQTYERAGEMLRLNILRQEDKVLLKVHIRPAAS